MARSPQDVTETELAVLQVLWDHGPATIRRITELIYPEGGPAHYATVQKLLDRLEAKGFVKRDRTLHVHLFSATVDREALVGRRIQRVVDTLCEGSLVPVLTHLASARGLTEQERKALRQLVRRRKGT